MVGRNMPLMIEIRIRLMYTDISVNLGKAAALPALPLITNVWSPIPIF